MSVFRDYAEELLRDERREGLEPAPWRVNHAQVYALLYIGEQIEELGKKLDVLSEGPRTQAVPVGQDLSEGLK